MHQDIGSIFKKLFKKKEGGQKRIKPFFGSDPREDWQKIIVGFFMLNLLVLFWSAYLFWQINSGDIFVLKPATNNNSEDVTRDNLKNITNLYRDRENKYSDLRLAKPVTIDPAI